MDTAEGLTVGHIAEMQRALGRKFEASDLDRDLYEAAVSYAKDYAGNFEYMAEMRDFVRRRGGLTDAQAKGVLNCMAAEGKRTARAEALTTTLDRPIPDGIYDVDTLDGMMTIKIRTNPEIQAKVASIEDPSSQWGWTKVAIIRRGVATPQWGANAERMEALRLLASPNAMQFATAFGKRTGRCGVCGRELTDPESIAMGIGPICAEKFGVL